MKYGFKKNYNNMQTGTFKLECVIPTTAKNGTTQLIELHLTDQNGKFVLMSNFRSVWDAALMNGFDFDKIGAGEDVEIDFVVNDGKYKNFVDIRNKEACIEACTEALPF